MDAHPSAVAVAAEMTAVRAILGLLLCGLLGACSGAPAQPRAESSTGVAALRAMAAFYAGLANYADTGTADYVGPDGSKQGVAFSTRFSRSGELRFDFRPLQHEPGAPKEDTSGSGTLTADSRESHVFLEGDKAAEILPIESGTGQLQGVTLHSSIFVPRMVYGRAFCACSLDALPVRVDGEEVIIGRKTIRLLVSSDPHKVLTLWIDAETYVLRQVRIARTDEHDGLHQTTIHYGVVQAL